MVERFSGIRYHLLAASFPMLLFALPCLAATPATFERQDYKVGGRPHRILAADFNVDGLNDIAVMHMWGPVSVLYGTGGGQFGKPKKYATGAAQGFTVGDFNADGRGDMAFVNGGIRVICGTPDGKFKKMRGVGTNTLTGDVVWGDYNADGSVDLAAGQAVLWGGFWHLDHMSPFVTVFYGAGDGNFTYKNKTRYAVASWPFRILQSDLNGDHLNDLLVLCSRLGKGTLTVLYGQSGGGFGGRTDYPVPLSEDIISGDFNNDGLADIALSSWKTNAVVFLWGQAGGGFSAPEPYPVAFPHCLAAGDFNGDGLIDIAVGTGKRSEDGAVRVLYGQETGGFGQETSYPVGRAPESVTAADLNGDGLPDIAAANRNSRSVSALLNTGNQP